MLRDLARFLRNASSFSALTALAKHHHFAESRRITQFSCPNLSENSRIASTDSRKAYRKWRKVSLNTTLTGFETVSTVEPVKSQIPITKPASAMDWLRRGESQAIYKAQTPNEGSVPAFLRLGNGVSLSS